MGCLPFYLITQKVIETSEAVNLLIFSFVSQKLKYVDFGKLKWYNNFAR
jgi:hypothetical protein